MFINLVTHQIFNLSVLTEVFQHKPLPVLIHTRGTVADCGAGELTEFTAFKYSSKRKLLKGFCAVILWQTNTMAFLRHLKTNQTLSPFPVLLAKC